jgi:hypothetical protein
MGAAVAGCGLLPAADAGVPIEELSTEPRELEHALADTPTGPHVEVLSGEIGGDHLSVVLQKDAEGACMAVWRGADGSQACGSIAGGALGAAFGLVMVGGVPGPGEEAGGGLVELAGIVASDVVDVLAELDDGAEAHARLVSLEAAQVDGQAFLLYLPAGAVPRVLVARDADGADAERLELHMPGAP